MTDEERIDRLQACLGQALGDRSRALAALTHKSFANEALPAGSVEDNERLEFLGDAVIDLAVSQRLMERCPAADEGVLSKARAVVVDEAGLAAVARALGLGELLRLGRGEAQTGGPDKPSVLANALEAVIAALYLERGMPGVLALVDRAFGPALEGAGDGRLDRDYKTRLQELAQARFRQGPRYRVIAESGPDHAKEYTVALFVGETLYGEGRGRSKKDAEQDAAKAALPVIEAAVETR
ncbi:MAG TPA: ribonuclease III [Myxococcales bacterium]|nr:ribonuclease III [Myxococcales bacterium]